MDVSRKYHPPAYLGLIERAASIPGYFHLTPLSSLSSKNCGMVPNQHGSAGGNN